MKSLLCTLLTFVFLASPCYSFECGHGKVDITEDWQTMFKNCTAAMVGQVNKELVASLSYLKMGSYFSQDTVNRPGFAKYFFDSASEEREHAIKIISYLLMRTDIKYSLENLITDVKPNVENKHLSSGKTALEHALDLEISVTSNIMDIIDKCDNREDEAELTKRPRKPGMVSTEINLGKHDYQIVDYLSEEFLSEQYKGQRELAGMIATLAKMSKMHGDLADFLFDKKLLRNELF